MEDRAAFSLARAIWLAARQERTGTELCPAAQDEPFHVPQTQRYCVGDFAHWDPKITTFPGLYAAGAAYGRALRAASQIWRPLPPAAACGTSALRSLNVLLAGACFAVTRALCRRLHPRQGGDHATLFVRAACCLALINAVLGLGLCCGCTRAGAATERSSLCAPHAASWCRRTFFA